MVYAARMLWVLSVLGVLAAATAMEAAEPAAVAAAAGPFNVAALGAAADGKTLATPVIQKAIDACSAAGGGTVYFPAGTYLTGTIVLKDGVTLYLDAGAVLLGSPRMADYAPKNLVTAKDARNIGLAGPGAIDGQGPAFWVKRPEADVLKSSRRKFSWVPTFAYDHPKPSPGHILHFENCTGVRVSDVTLRNSESWTFHLLACDDVAVRGVRIRNPLHGPNTDGIDMNACSNVTISDCDIYTADDAICLKNEVNRYADRPCRNITVTNCILTTACNAFKIGTGTRGDFQNIVFSNSVLKAGLPAEEWAKAAAATVDPEHYGNALAPLAGIAIETVDGGHVRGVAVSNIVMQGVRAPIFIRLGNRGGQGADKAAKPVPGTLQDVVISNVIAYGASTASSVTGLPGHMVRNVTLQNIRVTTLGGGTKELAAKVLDEREKAYPESTMWGPMPMFGLFARHVEGLTLRDVRIVCERPDETPLFVADDVVRLRVSDLETDSNAKAPSLVRLVNCRDTVLRDTPADGKGGTGH